MIFPGGEEEWEVQEVLSSRLHYGKLQYQVQWRGWDPDPKWYPASDFKNATQRLKRYHEQYPENAGPPARLEAWERAALANKEDPNHEDDDKPASKQQTRARRTRKR